MMGKNARMQMMQKDKEFVQHLYDIFKPLGLVGSEPKEYKYVNKESGKTYLGYQLTTCTFVNSLLGIYVLILSFSTRE